MTRLLRVKPVLGAAAVLAAVSAWSTHALVNQVGDATQVSTDLGKVDLKVNGDDVAATLEDMSVANMIPGQATAGVLTIANAGTTPARYSLNALATGTDDGARAFASALVIRVTTDGHTSALGRSETCSGKTLPGSEPRLATKLLGPTRRLAPGDSETICIEARLPETAPSSLQGMFSDITFEVTGTS